MAEAAFSEGEWESEDGLSLRYRDYPGGAGKPPLLCLHGLTRNGRDFTVRVPDFNADTRVCIDDRSDRVKLFSHAWVLTQQMPGLWGWGDRAYDMRLLRFGQDTHHLFAYNVFLEVLVTRGPIALFIFFAITYAALMRSAVGAANQQLIFDPAAQTLTYDPNIAVNNDQRIVARSEGLNKLVNVRFRAATKTGGIPDSSVILVELEVNDGGMGRRSWRGDADEADWVTSTRSFSINLRGP